MATYIISDTFDVAPETAVAAVQDFLGEEGLATVVIRNETSWATAVIDSLGLETAEAEKFTHLDTIIGPPLEELVVECTAAGATYLDISEGLLPIEVVPETVIEENPDLENLPEPPPEKTTEEKAAAAKKTTAAARKKRELPKPPPPAKKPDPTPPQEHVPVEAPPPSKVAEDEVRWQEGEERAALVNLVNVLMKTASNESLWETAKNLREKRA